jgi:DNA-directed RNA polymerase subunit RPC12/RpoP
MSRSKAVMVGAILIWMFIAWGLIGSAGDNVSDVFIGVLVVGVILVLVGFLCGQTRGDIEAGIAYSMVLGPIGWLLTLVTVDKRVKCPECGGVLAPGARRCMHCGERVVPEGVHVKCPACGELGFVREIDEESSIECPTCKRTFKGADALIS